jgi:hypothetical protein
MTLSQWIALHGKTPVWMDYDMIRADRAQNRHERRPSHALVRADRALARAEERRARVIARARR